jgi:hypothetical protein
MLKIMALYLKIVRKVRNPVVLEKKVTILGQKGS